MTTHLITNFTSDGVAVASSRQDAIPYNDTARHALAQELSKDLRIPGHFTHLDSLPAHYDCTSKARAPGKSGGPDRWVTGHPSGKKFYSITGSKSLYPHILKLFSGSNVECYCVLDGGYDLPQAEKDRRKSLMLSNIQSVQILEVATRIIRDVPIPIIATALVQPMQNRQQALQAPPPTWQDQANRNRQRSTAGEEQHEDLATKQQAMTAFRNILTRATEYSDDNARAAMESAQRAQPGEFRAGIGLHVADILNCDDMTNLLVWATSDPRALSQMLQEMPPQARHTTRAGVGSASAVGQRNSGPASSRTYPGIFSQDQPWEPTHMQISYQPSEVSASSARPQDVLDGGYGDGPSSHAIQMRPQWSANAPFQMQAVDRQAALPYFHESYRPTRSHAWAQPMDGSPFQESPLDYTAESAPSQQPGDYPLSMRITAPQQPAVPHVNQEPRSFVYNDNRTTNNVLGDQIFGNKINNSFNPFNNVLSAHPVDGVFENRDLSYDPSFNPNNASTELFKKPASPDQNVADEDAATAGAIYDGLLPGEE